MVVKEETDEVTEPEQLMCPITQVMYSDPVFVPESGNTYEREALVRYWKTSPSIRDPLTNLDLGSKALHTNWGVRREVQRFLDANPNYLPQGWQTRVVPPPVKASRDLQQKRGGAFALVTIGVALLACGCACLICAFDHATAKSNLPPASFDKVVETLGCQDKEEASSARAVYRPPHDSRLEAWRIADDPDSLLSVRLPANGRLSAEGIGHAVFSIFWMGFTAVWTVGAIRGGAPVFFTAFSLPFWGVGILMALNVARSIFVGELLVISKLENGGASVGFGTEIFGHELSSLRVEVEDLHGPPWVTCDTGQSCQLIFESGTADPSFGNSASLRRNEATWLRKLVTDELISMSVQAGQDPERFTAPPATQSSRSSNGQQTHRDLHRRSSFHVGDFSGFGSFGGFTMGPGFTVVIGR